MINHDWRLSLGMEMLSLEGQLENLENGRIKVIDHRYLEPKPPAQLYEPDDPDYIRERLEIERRHDLSCKFSSTRQETSCILDKEESTP